jgi:hypothetical protein
MLNGEHGSMSMSMSKNKFFLEYSIDIEGILKEYSLTHSIKYIMTWRNIFPCVHG